jgi:hypothetical protein
VCEKHEYRNNCKNVKKFIRIIFVRIILSIEQYVGGIPTTVRVGSERKASELSTQTQHFGTRNWDKIQDKYLCPIQFFPLIFRRVHTIAISDYQLPHVCLCLSEWNDSAPTRRISTKFDFLKIFFKNIPRNFKFHSKKNNGYFTWIPICIYDNISLDYS